MELDDLMFHIRCCDLGVRKEKGQRLALFLPRDVQTRQSCIRVVGGKTPTANNVPAVSQQWDLQ